jgi:hypothetical protein
MFKTIITVATTILVATAQPNVDDTLIFTDEQDDQEFSNDSAVAEFEASVSAIVSSVKVTAMTKKEKAK